MTNPVANVVPVGDLSTATSGGGVTHADTSARPAIEPSHAQPDLRLLIEKDETAGIFVYRIVDRRTGDVVRQYPRDQVLKMMDRTDYGPGSVIDART
jgi:flagellar protein FlaG